MSSRLVFSSVASMALTMAMAIAASDAKATTEPGPFADVTRCATIGDAAARLACYDRTVARLGAAQRSGEIAVLEKGQVQATRRSLFGLATPVLPFLEDERQGPLREIETSLSAVRDIGRGRLLFTLAEGGRWRQVEQRTMPTPRPGATVAIRRTPMGGYVMTVGALPAFRVQRID